MSEDEDVSDEVAAILRDDGITVLTSSTPVRVEPADSGRLRLTVRTADGERQLEGSHLLSAIGRIPNTEALTPEAAGIRLDDRGFIEVDEYLETSVPGVYAMGDVKGGPAFTHSSYDDYRILHANLIRHEKASTRDRIVPYTVFIDPQLGRVGMTEREARAQGRAIRVAKLPMSAVVRAIETGETRGFMKAVVDADSGQILGCAILGSEGGEIMTMIQVAMLGKLTYTAMADAIFTHPLLAEGLNTLFAVVDAWPTVNRHAQSEAKLATKGMKHMAPKGNPRDMNEWRKHSATRTSSFPVSRANTGAHATSCWRPRTSFGG